MVGLMNKFYFPKFMPILKDRFYELIKGSRTSQYIETGCYRGEGVNSIINHYDIIHSIELSDKWYKYNLEKFVNYPNVFIHLGDSKKVLPELLSGINEPVTIYLDAHYSGGSTAFGEEETPLLFELEFLKNRPYDDIIIIDDVRILGKKETCGISDKHPVYPTMSFNWENITTDTILSLVKPGYKIYDNYNNEFSFGSADQLILAIPEKTLVILIGNARGGEDTWHSMYKNLLDQYDADLALCFGELEEKTSSLYERAKYIWEIPEYENWREFYDNNFNSDWDNFLSKHKYNDATLMGGVDDFNGSGAIIFAFRHFLLKNKIDYIKQYDRIILTRSDFYYIDKHPILPLGKLYAVEGEAYGGVSDRHFIFDSSMSKDVLGILDFLCNESNYGKLNQYKENTINPEKALLLFFEYNKIIEKLEYCKRVQFTVAIKDDLTRWQKPSNFIPGFKNIKYKYISEYEVAFRNYFKKNGLFTKLLFNYIAHILLKIYLRIIRIFKKIFNFIFY